MAAVGLRAGGLESGGLDVGKEAGTAGEGDGDGGDGGAAAEGGGLASAVGASQDVVHDEEEQEGEDAVFSRKVRSCVSYISRHQFPPTRPSCLVPATAQSVYSASQRDCSCGGLFVHDGEVDATLITGVSERRRATELGVTLFEPPHNQGRSVWS